MASLFSSKRTRKIWFPTISPILGISEDDSVCHCENLYSNFELKPRKSQKTRTIDAPCPHLKLAQRALLDKVLYHVKPHSAAMAFVDGKSIALNARHHHGARHLFKTDIRNFFKSITSEHVRVMLEERFGHLSPIAFEEIVSLVTYEGRLPQGAPTSPHIANLVMFEFDERLEWLCHRLGATYTRYADDISISGEDTEVLRHVEGVVRDGLVALGLDVHSQKSRHFGPSQRKTVTGLDIGSAKIRPTRALRKKVATLVRIAVKYPSEMERQRKRIHGYFAFWHSIDPADLELAALLYMMGLRDWARKVQITHGQQLSTYLNCRPSR